MKIKRFESGLLTKSKNGTEELQTKQKLRHIEIVRVRRRLRFFLDK